MSIVRYLQTFFMVNDRSMYYEPIDCPMAVRTMTLNEELGQISHIFSDKTDTLTCNNMNFRKVSINGVSYGLGVTEISQATSNSFTERIRQQRTLLAPNTARKFSNANQQTVRLSQTNGGGGKVKQKT
eukprot:gene43161-53577_t